MSKGIMSTVIGGVEVGVGVVLTATGVGAVVGVPLIMAGAGSIMTGIAQMLEKQPGQGIATNNPVGPYNYIYGTMKVPGTCIFSETNSITQTGATTSNDKQWHRVFTLACHPTEALLQVRLDGQVLNLVSQGEIAPHIWAWQSASPTQTTCSIHSISRSGGIVTMVLNGAGLDSTFDGQTLLVSGVSGDNTLNGVWTMWQPNPSDPTTWQYVNGGGNVTGSGGKCETCLPDYSNKVHVEFCDGNQTQTFPGLLEAQVGSTSPLTWVNTDVCYGHSLVYIQFGYDSSYFPSYPTNLSFVVQGKNDILDPRTGGKSYSTNAALCIADYMAQPRLRGGFGLAIGTTIDENNLMAAASLCDETIELAVGGTTPQYTCNTVLDLETPRGTNIQRMLTSCAGRLSVQGGVWSIIPGAYVAPSLYLSEKNIVGPIELDTRLPATQACNAVKGVYLNPANNFQPSDYPLYQQDSLHGYVTNTWLVEDGNEILVHNLDLPCTNESAVAQRLAKIQLMRSRYQYRLHLQCDLTAYQATVTDVVALSIGRYNWVNEPFEVLHVGLLYDEKGKPIVDLDLAQVDGASSADNSAIYSWTPTEELTITDSIVPNNVGTRVCVAPENVVAYSGPGGVVNGITCPSTVITRADGTESSAIYVEWTTPNDANVVNGGHIEVQWQAVGASSWTSLGKVDPSVNYAWINNVSYLGQYNVQVRAVNAANVPSAWVAAVPTPITVVTATADAVTGVTVAEAPVSVNGVMESLIAIDFTVASGDTTFEHAAIYVLGYQGNTATPQLSATATTSPAEFLLQTTGETVTFYVVSVSASGIATPSTITSAPSASIVLNGQTTAPPAPSIAAARTALPNSTGWQFTVNVLGGLEYDLIQAYRIYHSENPDDTDPAYYTAIPQPASNVGTLTIQETTGDILFYWVSSLSVSGLESDLVPVGGTYTDPGAAPPSSPTTATTTQNYYPVVAANGWATGARDQYQPQNPGSAGPTPPGLGTAFGPASQTVNPYSNPSYAFDGNQTDAAVGTSTHLAQYMGCVWSFSNFAALPSGVTISAAALSIVSQVSPTSGNPAGQSSLWYSLDGGTTWNEIYIATSAARAKQTDTITISPTQDMTKLQVMGNMHAHDDLCQSIFSISLSITQAAPCGPEQVTGVTAAMVGGNVQISWNKLNTEASSSITSYQVYRNTHGGGYLTAHLHDTVTPTGAATYSWSDPEANTTSGYSFDWWVIAENATGYSPASAVATLFNSSAAVYSTGQSMEELKPAQANADKTSVNTAAAIAGQGALATQSAVALATQVSGQLPLANHAGAVTATIQGGGGIDFSSNLHSNKNLDNIGDSTSFRRVSTTHVNGSGVPMYANGTLLDTLMPLGPNADNTGSNTALDTANVNGVAAGSISPIAGLMPSQEGADVTSAHVLTSVSLPSSIYSVLATAGAIPSFGWTATSASLADVFNIFGGLAVVAPPTTSTLNLFLYLDGSEVAATITYAVEANATGMFPVVMSVTGLAPGSHTLQFWASMSSGGDVSIQTTSYAICQHIIAGNSTGGSGGGSGSGLPAGGTVTTLDGNSVVAGSILTSPLPNGSAGNESAALYCKPNISDSSPEFAFFLEIPSTQVDTVGGGIKIVHYGQGDAIYIPMFNSNGVGLEAASFVDGTKGIISTIQTAYYTPFYSTCFNALWGSASVPGYGIYLADQAPGMAYTAKQLDGGLTDNNTPMFAVVDQNLIYLGGIDTHGNFLSGTANPALSGRVRLANGETISWRNAANTADLPLAVNSSNQLTFNGNIVATPLTGTSASMGGSAMTAGATITKTVTVTGATTSMAVAVSPKTYPGAGYVWDAYVSAANTVTVRLTAVLAGTPTASVYNVRVIQ